MSMFDLLMLGGILLLAILSVVVVKRSGSLILRQQNLGVPIVKLHSGGVECKGPVATTMKLHSGVMSDPRGGAVDSGPPIDYANIDIQAMQSEKVTLKIERDDARTLCARLYLGCKSAQPHISESLVMSGTITLPGELEISSDMAEAFSYIKRAIEQYDQESPEWRK